jgi:hypothetical protein
MIGLMPILSSLTASSSLTCAADYLLCKNHIVEDDCPLFDAQRLWNLPFSKRDTEEEDKDRPKKVIASVHSSKHVVCQNLKSLLLPKDACMEVPMADPNMLLLATHLPMVSILFCYFWLWNTVFILTTLTATSF